MLKTVIVGSYGKCVFSFVTKEETARVSSEVAVPFGILTSNE